MNPNRFLSQHPCYYVLIIFPSYHVGLETYIVWCIKVELIFCQLSIFPNNSARIYPVKLNICMLYHKNNAFRNTVFYISIAVLFSNIHLSSKRCFNYWPFNTHTNTHTHTHTQWSNTFKQLVGNNCLSVFDNYLGLALKGLTNFAEDVASTTK